MSFAIGEIFALVCVKKLVRWLTVFAVLICCEAHAVPNILIFAGDREDSTTLRMLARSEREVQAVISQSGGAVIETYGIMSLFEVKNIIRKSVTGNDVLAGLIFLGHGNSSKYSLNRTKYDG